MSNRDIAAIIIGGLIVCFMLVGGWLARQARRLRWRMLRVGFFIEREFHEDEDEDEPESS